MSADAQTEKTEKVEVEQSAQAETKEAPAAAEAGKQTKTEKKATKALSKLGLKSVEGFTRVTLKKSKNVFFVIAEPEVYKSGETYVIVGEIKVEDQSALAQRAAAQKYQQKQQQQEIPSLETEKAPAAAAASSTSSAQEADEVVDESGVESKDIEVVMQQANVSRPKAVKALKNTNNDIVNAIMELTM